VINVRELLGKKKLIIYEVVPSRGTNQEKCFRLCEQMIDAGADLIAVTDMPTSKVKLAPWAVGKMLIDRGIEVLIHFTRITRNILRIESDLLGMHALGMKNILVLSGDDPKGGDYPHATVVNDITTEDLIRLVKMMNEGKDLTGKKLRGKTDFFVGGVFNPHSEYDVNRAIKKIESGADFLISQPVYNPQILKKVRSKLNVPVLVSVAFFSGAKQLKYFASIPGIEIPDELIKSTEGKSDSYVEGYTFDYLLDVIKESFDLVNGFYISGVVKNPDKVRRLAEFVKGFQDKPRKSEDT
jgi:methylenetetrahydrofolate reductase (NADPH)